MKINLNVYYSAACNMQCPYCCAGRSNPIENENIRASIVEGEFQSIVIAKCQELNPVTLGIWGMEPTINQDLWEQFIIPILDRCESIEGIFVPTNGINFNSTLWLTPLANYCNTHERKIKLWVQFSIDHQEADERARANLLNCISTYQTNQYFRLKVSTKSTLDQDTVMKYDPDEWKLYMQDLVYDCNRICKENCDIDLVGAPPTLAYPQNYHVAEGAAWGNWAVRIPGILNETKIIRRMEGCTAGIDSFTIDYTGQVYDCQLKASKGAMPTLQQFLHCAIPLYKNHLIKINGVFDWNKFYKVICSEYCPVVTTLNDLEHYILVWGNGAVDGVMNNEEDENSIFVDTQGEGETL